MAVIKTAILRTGVYISPIEKLTFTILKNYEKE